MYNINIYFYFCLLLSIVNIFDELEKQIKQNKSHPLSSKPAVVDSGEMQTLVSYYAFPFQRFYCNLIFVQLWTTFSTRIQDQLYNFLTTFTCESWRWSKSCKDESINSSNFHIVRLCNFDTSLCLQSLKLIGIRTKPWNNASIYS